MTLGPNVYDAEPIPEAARAEIDRLLQSGDLFRYTAPQDAPVALLEREFADMMGAKYALAVASCSAALFISLKALGLPRDLTKMLTGLVWGWSMDGIPQERVEFHYYDAGHMMYIRDEDRAKLSRDIRAFIRAR